MRTPSRRLFCSFFSPTANRFSSHQPFSLRKKKKMEWLEFLPINDDHQTTVLSSSPALSDDINVGEEFLVDELLDFSGNQDEEEKENEMRLEETVTGESENSNSVISLKEDPVEFPCFVPADELAELEWLSQFVDDSFSSTWSVPTGGFSQNPAGGIHSVKAESQFPARARKKRSRMSNRCHSGSLPCLIMEDTTRSVDVLCSLAKPGSSKRRKPAVVTTHAQPQRRCSHCHVQKTPQWRKGPLGSKTLCNACGVRYKSGRLLPEYRPAGSPTFLRDVHSNSHRKVLEMRRLKEDVAVGEPSDPQVSTS